MTPFSRAWILVLVCAFGAACGDSPGDPLDADRVSAVEVGHGYCGSAPDESQGARSVRAELNGRSLVPHRCIEGKGLSSAEYGKQRGDETKTRALTDDEVVRIRSALGKVRHASTQLEANDGPMDFMIVVSAGATLHMSPYATCGGATYDQVTTGYEQVSATLYELAN